MLFSRRSCNFIGFVACYALIAVAYFYMEKYLYLTPCPLCYAERIVFAVVGFFFLLAAVFPGGRVGGWLYGVVLFLLSAGGAALAIRHLYLQHLPKGAISNCGKDFYALVESTPLAEVVETMLTGSGECGDIQWVFLGLSIPGWGLIAFIALAFWGLLHNAFRHA